MDDGSDNADPNLDEPEAFNEWRKAASARNAGDGTATFDATFAFGRDALLAADANYLQSGDTAAESTTEVSFFDGVHAAPRRNDQDHPIAESLRTCGRLRQRG